ncbi:MAG: N-acetylmuramic acid 6-phosphate etherase, partial [Dehalococcoidia bacterium]|nr:N-acetylmuramic acid 6-phosphate etherase [Dehalococcoidia bacterium]
DKPEDAEGDLKSISVGEGDVVIGIASSGTTTYVLHALQYAKTKGSSTVFLICNPSPLVEIDVDVLIAVDVGQEVITGSTRMKSGTATKMILNMISTATMVRLGKVYGNLMVDLKAVNEKLVDRGNRIISQLTGLDYDSANNLLMDAEKEVKTAIVMHHQKCDYDTARQTLDNNDGFLRFVIETK